MRNALGEILTKDHLSVRNHGQPLGQLGLGNHALEIHSGGERLDIQLLIEPRQNVSHNDVLDTVQLRALLHLQQHIVQPLHVFDSHGGAIFCHGRDIGLAEEPSDGMGHVIEAALKPFSLGV
jgi:hypothetical protein